MQSSSKIESSRTSHTRLSLLSRARVQDAQAWRDLVALYGPLVAFWCRRCGLSSHATADCIQEVFASVSKSLGSFRPQRETGSFRGWLWTITSNRIKDWIRREQRHTSAAGGSTAKLSLEQIPELDAIPTDEPSSALAVRDLVHRAIDQVRSEFEQRTWDIFSRSVLDQLPTETVAQEFGIQPATVRQVRSRVLRRLREQLGDLEEA